jgi:hypothetical protein
MLSDKLFNLAKHISDCDRRGETITNLGHLSAVLYSYAETVQQMEKNAIAAEKYATAASRPSLSVVNHRDPDDAA